METMDLTEKLDYIRLVFRCDAEMFQNDYLPRINTLLLDAQRVAGELPKFEVNINGRTGRRESYFEVNVWGDQSAYFARSMPVVWWAALTRIDFRTEFPALSSSHIQSIVSFYNANPPKRYICDPFIRPNASKTNKRDVGGRGIRFGSRASKSHLVIYVRKGGYGAVEYRKGNKASQELGKLVANWDGGESPIEPYTLACNLMRMDGALFMAEATGFSSLTNMLEGVEGKLRQTKLAERQMELMELAKADDYWENLTPEEKDAMWDATWELPMLRNPAD